MLWEVEILPKHHDPEAQRVRQEIALLTHAGEENGYVELASRGFLLEGIFPRETAERLLNDLLLDPIAETGRVGELNAFTTIDDPARTGSPGEPASVYQRLATVLLKPGVMDPVAESVE